MRNQSTIMTSAITAAAVALLQFTPGLAAEEASPPTPRLADGTVDLGGDGYWNLRWITDFADHLVDVEEIPFLPWTEAMYEYNQTNFMAYDPQGFCMPPGGPRMFGTPYPAQIIQDRSAHRDRIIVIFEGGGHIWREIYMDGRSLPDPQELHPTYKGYAVGHWEDDTLVIETVGYNEKTWLVYAGYMHTDQMRTIERITRPNRDTLYYEATIIDPGAYSAPWTVGWEISWAEGEELTEYICQENNQFLIELRDDFGNPFFSRSPQPE